MNDLFKILLGLIITLVCLFFIYLTGKAIIYFDIFLNIHDPGGIFTIGLACIFLVIVSIRFFHWLGGLFFNDER